MTTVLRWGRAEVCFDASGTVTAVQHDADPGASYLESAGEVQVVRSGPATVWSAPEVGVDADEVEVVRQCGGLRAVVRHSFAGGWLLRLALSNAGTSEEVWEDVLLTWCVPAERPARVVAAGATGSIAVLARDGSGPVLGGTLRVGSVARVSERGLHLGRVVLPAGGRYVEQWQLGFHATPQAFDRTQRPVVPRRLDLAIGEAVAVPADEDEALVVGPGLDVDTVDGGLELSAWSAGRYRVEARSARGLTTYELAVAASVETVLAAAAAEVLAGPRTAAGTLRLADVDAALVVQHALGAGLEGEEAYAGEDALDLYGSRLPEEGPFDPRTVAFLCGEHVRTADPEPLAWAVRGLLAATAPAPGLGLAATRVSLALVLAGRGVAGVVEHLRQLVHEASQPPAATPRSAQAALLELEVVTMRRPGPAGLAAVSAPVVARTAALGGWLGAGLRGRTVPPLPVDELAHLAAVLALLPEPLSMELRGRWGTTAGEVARRARTEVLARLDGDPAGPAHGWLVLGSRAG